MRYYLDNATNQLWAFEEGQGHLIPEDYELVTEEQAQSYQEQVVVDTNLNKETARILLKETDWVELPSLIEPATSPRLGNKAEFMEYRNQVRAIFLNTPSGEVSWPAKPETQWID